MQGRVDRRSHDLVVIAFDETSPSYLVFDLYFLYIVDSASQGLRLAVKSCTILEIWCLRDKQIWSLGDKGCSLEELLLIEGLPGLVLHNHRVDLRRF